MCAVGDLAKLAFMQQALLADDPLHAKPQLDADVAEAIAWRKSVSAEEACKEREEVVSHIETAATKLRSMGALNDWKRSADPKVRTSFR